MHLVVIAGKDNSSTVHSSYNKNGPSYIEEFETQDSNEKNEISNAINPDLMYFMKKQRMHRLTVKNKTFPVEEQYVYSKQNFRPRRCYVIPEGTVYLITPPTNAFSLCIW